MISIIIAIISILVSLIMGSFALYQNKKAQRFQEKLAEAQNVFGKSEIEFEFFKTIFKDIIFVGDFPKNSAVNIPLVVYFGNRGNKKISNAELYVTYPNDIHPSALVSTTKGTIKDIKHKVVDETKYKHMIGTGFGDIAARTFIELKDFLMISDNRKTDSSLMDLETIVETADEVKSKLKFNVAISWLISFYLKYDEGSFSDDCSVHIWNTAEQSIEEYYKFCLPSKNENDFDDYFKSLDFIGRFFFKNRIRKMWSRTVQDTFLLIELDLEKDHTKYPLPKNAAKNVKDILFYNAIIKNQKLLFVLNDGNVASIDRSEFEKRNSISHNILKRHTLS